MTEHRDIVAKLSEFESAMGLIGGCGDGYCIIVKPKGMHTNGGCRCSRDHLKMQRFAYYSNRLVLALKAHLEEGGGM